MQGIDGKIQELEKRIAFLESNRKAPNKDCLTLEEVAEFVGCSPNTVRKHEESGELMPQFPNAKRRYLKEDVERFMRGFAPRKKTSGLSRKKQKLDSQMDDTGKEVQQRRV